MQNIIVGVIVVIILLLMLFPLWLMIKVSCSRREEIPEKKDEQKNNNFVSNIKSQKIILAEKQDIRGLSLGEEKTTSVFTDDKNSFFKSPESKELQSATTELLLKVVKSNRKKITEQHQKEYMKQSQKAAKDAEDIRQPKKLSNNKTQKKVAKTVAKKNIELDDEKMKKIKIKTAEKSR